MKQLRIVVSSTRPGRIGPKVAEWVAAQAPSTEWEVELVDLSTLPFFDEEDMPKNGNYAKPHTLAWASTVFESDAIVVVTPQYNRSFPAPIKNAIDYLFAEWDAKPVALVGYGWTGAVDATADLTKVLGHVKADVVGSTGLVFTQDVNPDGELTVGDERRGELAALFDALASRADEPVGATA
ncbi:NAD(P)H-dependent FMN reductase [Humibacillus xanthopallidus]|uniref:NAD(P)H-dependent FMN reductase n=1 Tax=Humibacillus xanthopallidus TaxID=412689 RepID=A0A543PME9_9MICO|nr:NAD(P)H-dependent oxidoreductase [Humibacillus xanthopallidus]TQN45255.1 NAD(P)H-dependent FMN reductase [Humibacillus xanthopallidus]